jgi:hypothetical protein
MTLTITTISGKKHIFTIANTSLLKSIFKLIQEPIRSYTLLRDDGDVSAIMVSN